MCLALSLCRLNRQSKGKKEQRHIVATAEFVGKSISSDFQIFDVFDQSKHDVTIGTIHSLKGTPKKAKYPPNKNCVTYSRHKIVWKVAYLGVSNHQESCLSQCKKTVKNFSKSGEKMLRFDLRQTEICFSRK